MIPSKEWRDWESVQAYYACAIHQSKIETLEDGYRQAMLHLNVDGDLNDAPLLPLET